MSHAFQPPRMRCGPHAPPPWPRRAAFLPGRSVRFRHAHCCLLAAGLQTASLLETVATVALKSRLKSHATVSAAVQCNTFSLLRGRVDAAAILGRRWASPLSLTAEVMEVRQHHRRHGHIRCHA